MASMGSQKRRWSAACSKRRCCVGRQSALLSQADALKASDDARKVQKLTSRKNLPSKPQAVAASVHSPRGPRRSSLRRPRRSIGRSSFSLSSLESADISLDSVHRKHIGDVPKTYAAEKVRWARGQPRDFTYTAMNLLPPPVERGSAWPLPVTAGQASPYMVDGRLIALCCGSTWEVPQAVAECGEQRIVRGEPRRHIEVFWAGSNTGWGVRALEDINAGDFVCEYAGEVLHDVEAEARCLASQAAPGRDAYLFDLTTPTHCRAFGAHPVKEAPLEDRGDDQPVFVIDAFLQGNVARFINHACGPSMSASISPIFVFTKDDDAAQIDARLPRVALFANRNIATGEELRYDYAMHPGDVNSADGSNRSLACHCGSDVCRLRIY